MGELLDYPGPKSPRSNILHSMYEEIPDGTDLDHRNATHRSCMEESENAFMSASISPSPVITRDRYDSSYIPSEEIQSTLLTILFPPAYKLSDSL